MEIKIKKVENDLVAKIVTDEKETDFNYISFIDWLYKNKGSRPTVVYDDDVPQADREKIENLLTKIIETTVPSAPADAQEKKSK